MENDNKPPVIEESTAPQKIIDLSQNNKRKAISNKLDINKLKSLIKQRKLILVAFILSLMLVTGYLFLQIKVSKGIIDQNSSTGLKVDGLLQPTAAIVLDDLITIETLNTGADIKFPFVREGNIYLYEDGEERLIAKPTQKTTTDACYRLLYPLISLNGKYIAYVEQTGEAPGYGGCLAGILRIVDVQKGTINATNYPVSYNSYSWSEQNQLKIETRTGNNSIKFAIYDPLQNKESVSLAISAADRDTGYRGFALFDEQKAINFKDNKYYLKDPSTNSESLILDGLLVNDFRGWSPDGRYAIFYSREQAPEHETAFSSIYFAIDTINSTEPNKEILVLHGAAGGDLSTGIKWYFDKGFISYCSRYLSFLDNTDPLELTDSGGGGCHNEEGFVATSPDASSAFVKFSDRFELHGKNGNKQIVKENSPVSKARGFPQNLIWLNNNYMVMFERVHGGNDIPGEVKPKIHIYDKQNNILKPLVENAYLIETSHNY